MRINNIGYDHCHDADFRIDRPDGSGDHLALLLKTPAVFTFDGKDIQTEANSVIIYRKGTPQYYRASGSVFANDWFHFELDEDEYALFDSADIPFDKVKKLESLDELSAMIRNMSYENYSSNTYKVDSTELYMKLFFLKLSEKLHSRTDTVNGSYHEKMSLIRSKIYNMPYNDWKIDGLAHELAMSRSYFQHLYKQIFGISAMNDVIRSRTAHAKYLLSTTDIPVNRIAEMCGYTNEYHFIRQFRSKTDMTPSVYRRYCRTEKCTDIKK